MRGSLPVRQARKVQRSSAIKMEKEKIEISVTVGGIILLAVIIAGGLKPKPRKAATAANTAAAANPASMLPGPAVKIIPADEQGVIQQKEKAKLAWGRDPFSASKTSREYQKSDLQLKGISLGKDKTGFAFINNDIVKGGDTIGGYEVIAVEKNRVLLKKSGQSFYLTLPGE